MHYAAIVITIVIIISFVDQEALNVQAVACTICPASFYSRWPRVLRSPWKKYPFGRTWKVF